MMIVLMMEFLITSTKVREIQETILHSPSGTWKVTNETVARQLFKEKSDRTACA